MIRLYFKVAEIYQEQKNTQEHHRYMVQGKKLAKSINVDLVFGPDTRFSSPEKTWQLFISSIEKDDLNAIAECFSPDSMVLQQNSISKSKNRLNVMGSDNMQLTIKVEENKIFVEYRFQRIVKGKTQTYGVSFSNIFEEWKIDGLDLRFIRFLEWENSDTSN